MKAFDSSGNKQPSKEPPLCNKQLHISKSDLSKYMRVFEWVTKWKQDLGKIYA